MSSVTVTSTAVAAATKRMSSDQRREQIIAAAMAVFGARGYEGTTTDEVAKAAGVSQPYVVRLFGTKEKLFLAAMQDALDRLLAGFRGGMVSDSPEGPEGRMGLAYLELLQVRGLHQLLSHAFLLGGHPVIGPAARDGFAEVWRYLRDEVGMTTAEGQQFLARGMLINTLVGLRITETYGVDAGMTELFDECFPFEVAAVIDASPRADEPW